jgi:tetratricopeptide (TPR) repeat protein
MALGWCYKRTNRLAQAIDALERALRQSPEEPLLHFNLACYWSLAGQQQQALLELTAAIEREPALRALAETEADLDPLRSHPGFERLLHGHAASS